jgi:uncharacterized membrane protein YeaQ/YmgE (transglycosylase-associated protein family)
MSLETLVLWIVIGGVAGIVADWLIPSVRLGLVESIVVGILGAFLGGWLLGALGVSLGTGLGSAIIVAIIGAVVLPLVVSGACRPRLLSGSVLPRRR